LWAYFRFKNGMGSATTQRKFCVGRAEEVLYRLLQGYKTNMYLQDCIQNYSEYISEQRAENPKGAF
jgi:hypothetical protein